MAFNTSELPSEYRVNDVKGTFITQADSEEHSDMFLGTKGSDYFTGVLARMDILTTFSRGPGKMCNLDSEVKESVLKEYYTFFDEEIPLKRQKCD